MRHLVSVVLALILSPIILISAGLAAVRLGEGGTVPVVLGLLAAVGGGALYAILVLVRLSPLGPALAGLSALGLTAWVEIRPEEFRVALPAGALGVNGQLNLPIGLLTAVLAVPLIATVFSPRRWRRTAEPGPFSYDAAPVYPTTMDSAAPTYDPSSYEPTSYTPPVYTPSGYTPAAARAEREEPPTAADTTR
jgi:hypothetical protein